MDWKREAVMDAITEWECKLSSAREAASYARRQATFYLRLLKEIDDGVSTEENVSRKEPTKLSERK